MSKPQAHKEEMSPTEEKGSPEAPDADSGKPEARRPVCSAWKTFIFTILYLVFLLAVVVGILAGLEYYAYLQVKASPLGKAYAGRDLDPARQSSQKVAPQFGYEPTPGFVAVQNTKFGNSYEYINDQSFKEFDDVPLEKPKDEFRVFVTGGSVVYGRGPVPPADKVTEFYEVTHRWTIPHIMQELLNADPRVREKIGGKKVRVINAGVAGHVIQNDLMRYLAKLRLYSPDAIVSLDGANEVPAVARAFRDWNYFTEGQYYDVVNQIMSMTPEGLLNYLALWLKRNTYFFAWLSMRKGQAPGILMENVGFVAYPREPSPEEMNFLKRNVRQVADVLAIYHKTLETDKVPHVFALQPMFRNCKKKRTPMEQRIEQVTGMQKVGYYDAVETYDLIVDTAKKRCAEEGLEVLDLTKIFDNVNTWVFTDWCHMTNGANYILAKALVNRTKKDVFGLSLRPSDRLEKPLDAYFTDYAKHAKVLVGGAFVNAGLHILKGYPGKKLLEVDPRAGGGNNSVVLDLGKSVPVSRLRIVWADKASVPRSWKIDFSEDGKSWKEWAAFNPAVTDNFDQWPGFEYYAADDSPARYVRYSPTGEDAKKPIKLRQLSLFK
jgi:hypothetical protein